jgi:beta-galactosidase
MIPKPWFTVIVLIGYALAAAAGPTSRKTLSLDGRWQIAEGALEAVPAKFEHEVVVPGLVDMANPPFDQPGPKVASRNKVPQKDPRRDAFWYRRTFRIIGPIPAVATLKVSKAMFGTRVLLNGTLLGDHAPCFTPGFFDAGAALKSGVNELLIRVGADRDAVTAAVPSGFDYEKERYIPGIFDSVELILAGTPNIVNVQVTPDLSNRQARVRVWLKGSTSGDVRIEVREAKSRKLAGQTSARLGAGPELVLDLAVPISNCRLWSPETPFLYEVTVRTSGDEFTTRFGMREFKFDPATGQARLNAQPYFLRGSNFTLYRFFEDPARHDLPWRDDWVRRLHRRVKDMHWNCLRYCIGFPPEAWYRIADEEGILIQDEFPIWFGGQGWSTWPKELKADELAKEYAEWMRERWNHPSVAIWDASNETTTEETVRAVQQVRSLDLSNRPWDNSYMPPAQPGDVLEQHPYHFHNATYKLRDLATANAAPWKNAETHGVIINEYGWLWLNRDGTPTTLTTNLYQNLLGTNSTTEQRRRLYARYTAAETEFWRSHRTVAAVMHFTTLGYSRPDGQTSDHWLDVRKLTWEPEFYRYVRDAFAPVGLMIDSWAEDYAPAKRQEFPVVLINDLNEPWRGGVRFRILRAGKTVAEQRLPAEVAGLGSSRVVFTATIPESAGDYQAEAVLTATPTGQVRSWRDFAVLTVEQCAARRNLAEGRPVKASSVLVKDGQTYRAEFAVDGKLDTRWSSEFGDPQWLAVDLGETQTVSRVELVWETAFAKSYALQVSMDGENWKDVYTTDKSAGNTETLRFAPAPARWVRLYGTKRATPFGDSLWEFGIYH